MEIKKIIRNLKNTIAMECYCGMLDEPGKLYEAEFGYFDMNPEGIEELFKYTVVAYLLEQASYKAFDRDNVKESILSEYYQNFINPQSMPLYNDYKKDKEFKIYKFRAVYYNNESIKCNLKLELNDYEHDFIKNEMRFISGDITKKQYLVKIEDLKEKGLKYEFKKETNNE